MTCTQAKVSKKQIYKAYENFCLFHRDYIFRIKEPYIQKAMEHKFWQKILGKPARTREEAIDWCDQELIWTDYKDCHLHYWREHQALKDLVSLCDLTEEQHIMLTPEDASYVQRNLGEQS